MPDWGQQNGEKTGCGAGRARLYRGAAGGWHCFRMNVERKNLPCSNHRGVLCGKENMPKRFRRSETRLRIFYRNIPHH